MARVRKVAITGIFLLGSLYVETRSSFMLACAGVSGGADR